MCSRIPGCSRKAFWKTSGCQTGGFQRGGPVCRRAAQCDDILEKLPQGLDTVVGTKGVYLSGGEQQRIALARAILKDAPIIVLDEATAFADPENEHRIQKAFEVLTKGKNCADDRPSPLNGAGMRIPFLSCRTERSPSRETIRACWHSMAPMPPCGRITSAAPGGSLENRERRRERYDKEVTAFICPQ